MITYLLNYISDYRSWMNPTGTYFGVPYQKAKWYVEQGFTVTIDSKQIIDSGRVDYLVYVLAIKDKNREVMDYDFKVKD